MPKTIRAERAAKVADLIAQGKSQREAAALTNVPRRSVRRIIASLGPEIDELKDIRRDEMLMTWQDTYFRTYEQLRDGDHKPGDLRNLAIVMGIATEKASLLAGIPTAIVANVHEVRVSMPDLLSKLAAVGRVIGAGANPSPVEAARIKEALALSPASEPSGQAHPPTSDNTIYVTYAKDGVTPASTRTSDASA